MKTKLWIVGQAFQCDACSLPDGGGRCWEFQGVFDSKEKAIAACREPHYFIFSAELNAELPHESTLPPEGIYPKAP